jgi:hypothetical protein
LAVPPRAISAKFFSNETQRDGGGGHKSDQVDKTSTCVAEATKGRQGHRTDLVDNINEVPERPTGTSIEAGLRSLQKAAASKTPSQSAEKKTLKRP